MMKRLDLEVRLTVKDKTVPLSLITASLLILIRTTLYKIIIDQEQLTIRFQKLRQSVKSLVKEIVRL